MDKVILGGLEVGRFILGGNPFSGFSHRGVEADREMMRYFTTARIKETLRTAESLGVDTLCARSDAHIMRVLMEYRDEGGGIKWLAQSCPELGAPEESAKRALEAGADACYIHGGVMDFLLAQGRIDEVQSFMELVRAAGKPVGVAGHSPRVFEYAEERLNVDFYMCCYYNPSPRDQRAEHIRGTAEWFREEDRAAMTDLIRTLSKPAIHYKVMAAGRNDPAQAFAYAARHLRPSDAVCVGVYPKDNPNMLAENLILFRKSISSHT